ncbi:MAG: AAA family ATPase, partial [Anaerolineae bacterium]|nr:AAA family ATPase [Anaerolineae bacterium]
MTMLHLEFLGQVRIALGGEPISELASDKLVALLAYLALTGDTFSRPQLEALLWGESPPENAQTSLRTAVYNLNKRLDNALQSTRRTIWFAPERPFTLDVQQFRTLISQGDSDSLQTAVSLYRGDFLAGLTIADAPEFEMWLLQERERLRLDMLKALEKLMDMWLVNGRVDLAITAARRLLEIEPWRESTHRDLMRILARSGDYNGAIKQYQQCCAMLTAELDVPPMPETEALYAHILTLRQRPPQSNLPTTLPELVGREPELALAATQLADPACRLLVISGMGGLGKTSLALAIAARHSRHFLDGVYVVSLAGLESEALLDTAVAEALNIPFPAAVSPRAYLCQQLKSRELLLVLDNAEHLLTAVEAFIQTLLQAAPAVKIILTSREKPRLRASHLPLAGLTLPDAAQTAVLPSPATILFAQHARRVRPDFSLADEWAAVV